MPVSPQWIFALSYSTKEPPMKRSPWTVGFALFLHLSAPTLPPPGNEWSVEHHSSNAFSWTKELLVFRLIRHPRHSRGFYPVATSSRSSLCTDSVANARCPVQHLLQHLVWTSLWGQRQNRHVIRNNWAPTPPSKQSSFSFHRPQVASVYRLSHYLLQLKPPWPLSYYLSSSII